MSESNMGSLMKFENGVWINTSTTPEFNSEDLLILKPGKKLDYGINPVATVKNYKKLIDGDWSIDVYELVVEYKAPVFDFNTKEIVDFAKCVKSEFRSKLNVEELFKKVNVSSVYEAMKLYENK